VNISLPDTYRAWLEAHARNQGKTVEQCLLDLLDRERDYWAETESKLLEGLASGPTTPMTDNDWSEIHRDVAERATRRSQQ
jgi:hypothetical protein